MEIRTWHPTSRNLTNTFHTHNYLQSGRKNTRIYNNIDSIHHRWEFALWQTHCSKDIVVFAQSMQVEQEKIFRARQAWHPFTTERTFSLRVRNLELGQALALGLLVDDGLRGPKHFSYTFVSSTAQISKYITSIAISILMNFLLFWAYTFCHQR